MSYPDSERRKHPRVDVLGQLEVLVLSDPMPAKMLGLSVSGFSLETGDPVSIGASYRFQFQFLGVPVQVDATCVHCTRISRMEQQVYLAGFDFDPLERRARQTLTDFIDQIVGAAVD